MKTVETTATEVWCHAQDHGDRPVIHGAEIDYDDVHDGVHYHADLLEAAIARVTLTREKRETSAVRLAIFVDLTDASGSDPRTNLLYPEALAEFRRLSGELDAARAQRDALMAKRDQDAAFKTYEVSA